MTQARFILWCCVAVMACLCISNLCISTAQALPIVLFDEDFEDPGGINTTDSLGPNYIRTRYSASEFVPDRGTDQSVSPTHSHQNDDSTGTGPNAGKNHTEWFYMISQQNQLTLFEAWARLDSAHTNSQEIGIWGHGNPQLYAAAARMRRLPSGNWGYWIGDQNVWNDSGIAYDPNTWYRVGFEADPSDGSIDLFISTTANLGAPIASGSCTALCGNGNIMANGVGGIYNYSDEGSGGSSGDPAYFIDDVLITTVPEPASLVLLACGGLLVLRRSRRRY